MIHYHGLPITPDTAAFEVAHGGHAFVSFAHSGQIGLAMELCQSFALDNGAFSSWKNGNAVADWAPYYDWVKSLMNHPGFDFACIPDVIDGDEYQNDELVDQWPHGKFKGAPVWHLHESLDRLRRLASEWNRVCIGSSGEFSTPGSQKWTVRMADVMNAVCDFETGHPRCKLHGLRMLNPKVFTKYPFASADSTNIGRNIGIDKRWTGSYPPPTKASRAKLMRVRIENENSAQIWDFGL